jgi:sugar lactone lactonase YvrE
MEVKNMKLRWISLIVFLSFTTLLFSSSPKSLPNLQGSSAWGEEDTLPFPKDATFTTLTTTPFAIEGLTGDRTGNLYTAGRAPVPDLCPVWRINKDKPDPLVFVGFIPNNPAQCNPLGIAFDAAGNLYIADLSVGVIWVLAPSARNQPIATPFASGVPGANGIAFDKKGNLWVSDGTTGQGRVWKITSPGANCTSTPAINCEEVFRIQPMSNEVNLDANGVGGVGRDIRDLPPGLITVTATTRNAALNTVGCPTPPGPPCALGSQPLVANGLAFNRRGDLFNIDTARGALWKIEFDVYGNLKSPTGCDTTFTENTLCLSNIFVAHPILEGGDGIALDVFGNIWVAANERNAVAFVTRLGKVFEVFRNPVNLPPPVPFEAGLRNAGDQNGVGNNHILEFPTSPFLIGKLFCTASSDGNRRDNSPNTAGEIRPNSPAVGKISCMDQDLIIPGLRLPVE